MLFKFGNILGWYTFLALIPLIIIYLIKPRPTKLKIPSLMFFMKNVNTSTAHSLFRHFQNDLLFFIQLLIFLLLAFSIVEPVLVLNRDVVSSNIVFVLDVSASSKVIESNNMTRFEIAKDKIKDLATSKNSLILLKSYPVVALQSVGRSSLLRYLDRLQPTDDTTDIASAISLGGEILGSSKGRIVVVSDLIVSKGISADVAKNVLESRGIHVDFLDTKTDLRSNVGIVDMIIRGEDVNLYLKNYNNIAKDISFKVNKEVSEIHIGPLSVEPFVFTLNDNLTIAKIIEQDDFLTDNEVVITRPYLDKIKVLFISNKPSKFLKAAFTSIDDVVVSFAEPPIIPDDEYDVYILDGVDKNKLVVDNFGSVMRKVRDRGKAAVVVAQPDSDKMNYEGLLPVRFNGFVSGGLVDVQQINRFTKDIDFGIIKNIFNVDSADGTNLVSVNGTGLVSLFKVGGGSVVYYGILDSESDFKLTPGYPVFWNNLIYFLVGREDLNNVNLKSGTVFGFLNETVVLDKQGLHNLNGKPIAINLLNEKESDISFVDVSSDIKTASAKLDKIKSDVDYDLAVYLSSLILLLILFELFYIKFRGEI